jgi:hypothetical protein
MHIESSADEVTRILAKALETRILALRNFPPPAAPESVGSAVRPNRPIDHLG